MTNTLTIIDSYPAFDIVAGSGIYETGDTFAIGYDTPRHGRLYNFYKLGCVEDYARQYNDDVEEAVARAKENRHNLYWANTQATVLHNGPRVKEIVPGANVGDIITYKGKQFRLERYPFDRHNIKLVEITA